MSKRGSLLMIAFALVLGAESAAWAWGGVHIVPQPAPEPGPVVSPPPPSTPPQQKPTEERPSPQDADFFHRAGSFAQIGSAIVAVAAAWIAIRAQFVTTNVAIANMHEKFWNDKEIAEVRSALVVDLLRKELMNILAQRTLEKGTVTNLCSSCYRRIDQVDQFLSVLFRASAFQTTLLRKLFFRKPEALFQYYIKVIRRPEYQNLRAYAETFYEVAFKRLKWKAEKPVIDHERPLHCHRVGRVAPPAVAPPEKAAPAAEAGSDVVVIRPDTTVLVGAQKVPPDKQA